MSKWYVEQVYTPEDTDNDRTRKYGEFEAEKGTAVRDLGVLAMVSIGWVREVAERHIKEEADLDGTTVEDGGFDFMVFSNNGEFAYQVSKTPIAKAVAWVVLLFPAGKPVAVRPCEPREQDLAEIAARLGVVPTTLGVVKVEDVVG